MLILAFGVDKKCDFKGNFYHKSEAIDMIVQDHMFKDTKHKFKG